MSRWRLAPSPPSKPVLPSVYHIRVTTGEQEGCAMQGVKRLAAGLVNARSRRLAGSRKAKVRLWMRGKMPSTGGNLRGAPPRVNTTSGKKRHSLGYLVEQGRLPAHPRGGLAGPEGCSIILVVFSSRPIHSARTCVWCRVSVRRSAYPCLPPTPGRYFFLCVLTQDGPKGTREEEQP
jgi:hypothetical protein